MTTIYVERAKTATSMGDIEGVNKVRSDGRYKLPPELGKRYRGQHLAAYMKDGRIILEPVEVDE